MDEFSKARSLKGLSFKLPSRGVGRETLDLPLNSVVSSAGRCCPRDRPEATETLSKKDFSTTTTAKKRGGGDSAGCDGRIYFAPSFLPIRPRATSAAATTAARATTRATMTTTTTTVARTATEAAAHAQKMHTSINSAAKPR